MKKRWLGVGVTAEILGVFNDRHVEMGWVLWGYRWGSRKTRTIIDISTWDNISTIFQHVPCIPCCYWTIFQQQWGYKGQKGDRTNMKQLTRGWTQNRNNYTPYIDNIYENMKQPCWGIYRQYSNRWGKHLHKVIRSCNPGNVLVSWG